MTWNQQLSGTKQALACIDHAKHELRNALVHYRNGSPGLEGIQGVLLTLEVVRGVIGDHYKNQRREAEDRDVLD